MQLSIIIVNYNVKYFLEQCLCSVVKACKNIDAEIFVVDNNSTDGSKEFFNNRFPQVQFIWKHSNDGFAKANNEAVKLAKGERVLFLNPDTILPEDCLDKCLQFFKHESNIGALGVKMIDGSGNFLPESKRGFPSFFTSFCKMTGLTDLFPHSKIFARYYLGHLPEDKTNEADVLSGAFMMVDKIILDIVGSFDEDYFMYAEDIDLSYRMKKAGYKNFYFSDTAIIHFKGESVSKQNPEYIRNFYGTMLQFIQKHYSGVSKGLYVILLKFFIGIKMIFRNRSTVPQIKKEEQIFMIGKPALLNLSVTLLQKRFTHVNLTEKIIDIPAGRSLLLCEAVLPFKEIISIMQQHHNKYQFYIQASNAESIVGSGNKKQQGVALSG